MNKRTKLVLGIIGVAIVLAIAAIYILTKTGTINLGIFADSANVKTYGYRVNTDVSKGEVFSSDIKYLESRPVRQVKLTAIPKSAAYRFDRWEADKKQCTFLDKTKAITVAKIGHGCKITAVFKDVAMESSHEGYEEICKPSDFDKIRNNLSGKFVQTCDIDMAGIDFVPIGAYSSTALSPLVGEGSFSGTYDGNGKTINNININTGQNHTAIFSGNSGTIKNMSVIDAKVSGGADSVSIIAASNLGTIDNSLATGEVIATNCAPKATENQAFNVCQRAGGVTGESRGTISNSVSKVKIYSRGESSSINFAAGVVGYNVGKIVNTYTYGSIENVRLSAGGIAGMNQATFHVPKVASIIDNSFANVNITTEPSYDKSSNVGGLVGKSIGIHQDPMTPSLAANRNIITNSFAIGNITGKYAAGGLVGSVDDSHHIENVYSYGNSLTGTTRVGGLIGTLTKDFSVPGSVIDKTQTNVAIYGLGGCQECGGFSGSIATNGIIKNASVTSVISQTGSEPMAEVKNSCVGGFTGGSGGAWAYETEDDRYSIVSVADRIFAKTKINLPNTEYVAGFSGCGFQFGVSNSYTSGSIIAKTASGFYDHWPIGINSSNGGSTVNINTDGRDTTGKSNWNDFNTSGYSFKNNYANVSLQAEQSGGFIREFYPATYRVYTEGNYFNKDTAKTDISAYGTAKTTQEMKDKSTYKGWDFNSIWNILPNKNSGYPFLRN